MRLTLRTLLAYLDDVLDPVDKEELSQKIQSSEFAEDLVHRTRDTVRRLRLSAPQVIGTGMGLDPNTVAEYLDNVMPPEQVGDFERICLESDVHLAEATACHHVLTMILGEPADVDPLARQRMYSIASEADNRRRVRVEQAHSGPGAAVAAAPQLGTAAPVPELPASLRPDAVEVPDYLRAGSWWKSTGAVVGLAAILLVGITALFASGVRGWFGKKPTAAPLVSQNAPAEDNGTANLNLPARTEPSTAEPATDNIAANQAEPATSKPLAAPPQLMTPGLPSASNTPVATNPAAASTPSNPPPATSAAAEPDRYAAAANPPAATAPPTGNEVATSPPSTGTNPPANTTSPANTAGSTTASTTPSIEINPPAAPPLTSAPPITPPQTTATNNTPPAENVAASTPLAPPVNPTETATPATSSNSEAVTAAKQPASIAPPDSGTYMGGKTVLLRYDDKSGAWFRVEPRSAVIPGERVLALPEFRPKIALISGLQLDLSGGTQIVMGGGEPPAGAKQAESEFIPTIELAYGRAVLINPTSGEKQVRLKLGPAIGTAKLARNATLAAEVEHQHVPGLDPRQTPSPVQIRLFAPDGGVKWQDAAGEKVAEKASRWTLTDSGASDLSPDPAPPEWINDEPIVSLSEQRLGAPVIQSTLVSTAPVETQMLEMFQGSPRKEVRSLLARSSIYVGVFQPFIEALRDSDQKAGWKTHIDTLRTAMALNPDSANKVYQALVDQRGKPAAADLYEMLCGYNADQVGRTPEQMKTGAVSKLINWLEDDSLDYRVLAVQDLWEITGKRLMLNPAAKLPERTQNVKRWRSQLEAGDLKLVTPASG